MTRDLSINVEHVTRVEGHGNIVLDVKNGEGPTCLKETSELEKKLGVVKTREKKLEYYKKVGIKGKEYGYSGRQ